MWESKKATISWQNEPTLLPPKKLILPFFSGLDPLFFISAKNRKHYLNVTQPRLFSFSKMQCLLQRWQKLQVSSLQAFAWHKCMSQIWFAPGSVFSVHGFWFNTIFCYTGFLSWACWDLYVLQGPCDTYCKTQSGICTCSIGISCSNSSKLWTYWILLINFTLAKKGKECALEALLWFPLRRKSDFSWQEQGVLHLCIFCSLSALISFQC